MKVVIPTYQVRAYVVQDGRLILAQVIDCATSDDAQFELKVLNGMHYDLVMIDEYRQAPNLRTRLQYV